MNYKYLTLALAAAAVFQAAPVLADDYGHKKGGKMFEQHDANGDGVITKEEFLAVAEERFEKMDENGDGEVSKEEAGEVRESFKDKMKEKREKWKEKKENMQSSEE